MASPIDFNGLDTAIHGPVRLGVLTSLHTDGALTFSDLKKRLEVSDGALGLHLQKLEELNYVAVERAFVGKRPQSTYRLTDTGREAFARYLDAMRRLLDAIDAARPT